MSEEELDAFILQRYKEGKCTMKEVIEMPEKTILYPNLYLFYHYILLEERVLTEVECAAIYDLVP